MTVYSEEQLPIPVGRGLDIYNHPANVEDGYTIELENMIAYGDRLVSRKGLQPPTAFDSRQSYANHGYNDYYSKLPSGLLSSWPIAMYGNSSHCTAIRSFNRASPAATDYSSPGVTEFSGISGFKAACTYLDRFYILSNSGVDYLTSWNWSAGTVTKTNVQGSPLTNAEGLFVFKDRMWAWSGDKLYYTDVPSTPGSYPETWDSAANFVVVGAAEGTPLIYRALPIRNRILIFTSHGLFTLNAAGTPASWTLSLVDNRISANHHNCATELDGLVYFIDINGVWATDGFEVKNISSSIEPIFETAPDDLYYYYKLVPFNQGILIARQTIAIEGSYPGAATRVLSECKLYFTRVDFIAWTEFTVGTINQPMDLLAGWNDIESHDSFFGENYLVLAHGVSTVGVPNDGTSQLLKYTGYQDKLRQQSASEQTSAVSGYYKTKIIRGQLFEQKRAKYAYINLSGATSLPDNWNIWYQWKTEKISPTVVNVTTAVGALQESMQKIKADFYFRHFQISVGFTLDSGITEYTFLGAGLILHTHRREPRRES